MDNGETEDGVLTITIKPELNLGKFASMFFWEHLIKPASEIVSLEVRKCYLASYFLIKKIYIYVPAEQHLLLKDE